MEKIFPGRRLERSFFERDSVAVARDIVGKILVTCINGTVTSGRIVEAEAYRGVVDRASHVYGGKFSGRRKFLLSPPGHIYVYRIYGNNLCFNITTGGEKGSSVFIRSLEPLTGVDVMIRRRGGRKGKCITRGPSNLAKALGIGIEMNGMDIVTGEIICVVEGDEVEVVSGRRINIDYAGEDRDRRWRFYMKNNPCVTRR